MAIQREVPDIEKSEQFLLNKSFDKKYDVLAVELLVENDAGDSVVRLKPSDFTGSSATIWGTNDISADGVYFGQTTSDGTWRVLNVTETSVSYATESNNGSVTSYTDAWTNKETLTYGRYDEAF